MSAEHILVVDDEPDIREIVGEILTDEDYSVAVAENAESARDMRTKRDPDLVLLDIWMPGTDGISLLKEWNAEGLDIPVIMISGHGNVETAVEAVRYGAYDFLEKPLSTAKLLVTVERALQTRNLKRENKQLRSQLEPATTLIGSSDDLKSLRATIDRVGPTESWALITGEPGSGKGVVASCLHRASNRRDGPFVHVSLGAVPADSLAVQLFGSEENGVINPGYFDKASGGTLFLDAISDTDLAIQAKLLSALEDGSYIRVGGQERVDIDVRVLCATNQNLAEAVAGGTFREDLYYRINALTVHVTPLRTHVEDIPELVRFYVDLLVETDNLIYRQFSIGALNALRNHDWPGNVRELRNIVQRLLISNKSDDVEAAEVADALGAVARPEARSFPKAVFELPLRDARDEFEKSYLEHHLDKTSGNMTELASAVGLERTHLYRKLKGLGIDPKSRKAD